MRMRTPSAFLAAASIFYLTAVSVGFSFLSTTPAAAQAAQAPATAGAAATYVGSQACRRCHAAIYERWSKTRMANVVTDPHSSSRRHHSRSVASPIRCVTFTLDDIAFVYGSKWKQRYFTKVGDDYFPLGAQWDVTHKLWRALLRARRTPTGGCSSIRPTTRSAPDRSALRRLPLGQLRRPDEDGHGMERRLRAMPRPRQRARRAARPPPTSSIPRGWTTCAANDTCIQCHSQGQPLDEPDRRAVLRLAGRLPPGRATSRTSGSSRSTSSARRPSRISPTARRTRTACRATTSCRA